MIPRKIAALLRSRLNSYPAVALVGTRQCGKTTLARSLGGLYFDAQHEPDRLRLDLDWDTLVAGSDLMVLDEAQDWPELFPRLRGAIDRDRRRTGRFLLLGSVSPTLMRKVSESLAGRLSLIELAPLAQSELEDAEQRRRHWLVGGYPDGGVLHLPAFPWWQLDYLNLLVQRDLPNWGLTARPQTTHRLVKILAISHGQEWNASGIGKSLGLSYHTVNSYLDFLEDAFLVRRLPAFHANIRKRLVKRPKVYWRDSGLLHAVMGVSNREALLEQPWVGASWEGYVIDQILTELAATDRAVEAYHARTSDKREVDLLVRVDSELWAIEAKLTSRPRLEHLARLDEIADLLGARRRFLVCPTSEPIESSYRTVCDLDGFIKHLG